MRPFVQRTRTLSLVLFSLLVLASLAACGPQNSVGGKDITNFVPPSPSPTPVQAATPTPQPTAATGQTTPRPTQPPPTIRPTTAPKPVIIKIRPDTYSPQFSPQVLQTHAGIPVQFENTDTIPRAVAGDHNEFSSGLIAPGTSYVWVASGSGQINYHDASGRPSVVGEIDLS